MTALAPANRPDLPDGWIQSTTARCVRCGYQLKGLRYDGRCPECGQRYSYRAGGAKAAAAVFDAIMPRSWRCFLSANPTGLRAVAVPLLVFPLYSAAFALLVVVALFLANTLGTVFGVQHMLGRDAVAYTLVGKMGAFGVRWSIRTHTVLLLFQLLLFAQYALALVIWLWYAVSGRGLGPRAYVMRRLGLHATLSIPAALAVPLTAAGVWQVVNIAFPARCGSRCTPFPSPGEWLRDQRDWISFSATLILVGGTALTCWLLFRRHRRAIHAVRCVLLDSRIPEQVNDTDATAENG